MLIHRHLIFGVFLSVLIQLFWDEIVSFLLNSDYKEGLSLRKNISKKILNPQSKINLNHYSFFSSLLFIILETERKHGVNITPLLKNFRKHLISKLQLDKKINDRLKSLLIQNGFLLFFIFCYSFFLIFQLEVKIDSYFYIFPVFILLIVISVSTFHLIYLKLFNSLNILIREIIKLSVLQNTSLSTQEILDEINFNSLEKVKDPDLTALLSIFFTTIYEYRTNGKNMKTNLDLIESELIFLQNDRFQKFDDCTKGLKVILSIIFILPTFFYLNLQIIEKLF